MSAKPLITPLFSGPTLWKSAALAASVTPVRRQQRNFSTASPRRSDAISFHPTENPELEQVLSQVNKYVIYPTYLKGEQRRQLLDPGQRQGLPEESIKLNVAGKTIQYQPPNMLDCPSSNALLKQALDNLKSDADWKNLMPLLQGFRQAGRVLHADTRSKIIRRAAKEKRWAELRQLIIEAPKTGFFMNAHEPIATYLLWIYREAMIEHAGSAESVRIANDRCDWFQHSVLDTAQHGHNPIAKKPHVPLQHQRFQLHQDPQFLCVLLGLRAHDYLSQPVADKPSTDSLRNLAKTICQQWMPRNPKIVAALGIGGQGLGGLHPADSYFDANWCKYLRSANKRLAWEAVIVRSVEDAAEILVQLEPRVAQQLGRIAEVVRAEAEIDRENPNVTEKSLGLDTWTRLVERPTNRADYKHAEEWRPPAELRGLLRQGRENVNMGGWVTTGIPNDDSLMSRASGTDAVADSATAP